MRKLPILLLGTLLLLGGCTPDRESEKPEPIVATLTVAGDVMNHDTQIADAYDAAADAYDYGHVFQYAKPWLEASDYAVANLETTLPGDGDYTGYPCFGAPDALAYDLKEAGFDLLSTANNHTLDRGTNGVSRTLDVLDKAGLAHTGSYRSQEERSARNAVAADVGGIQVAFLAYTYGLSGCSLPPDQSYAVNCFSPDSPFSQPDKALLAADLAAARELGADLVAVMIHWGAEYRSAPTDDQRALAEFLVANGADLVLGSHPHVIQPYETVTAGGREGFVCYSLGNFISAQSKEYTDITALLQLELTKDESGTRITGAGYIPFCMIHLWSREKTDYLLDAHRALGEYGENDLVTEGVYRSLERAVAHCHEIFGAEGDLGQAPE